MTVHVLDAVGRHIATAKRLLVDLERYAETAVLAMSREDDTEFFAALDVRETLLGDLSATISALAHAHAWTSSAGAEDPHRTMLTDVAHQAAAALEAQERLAVHCRKRRDELAGAIRKLDVPDLVAHRYAASGLSRRVTLSVTG